MTVRFDLHLAALVFAAVSCSDPTPAPGSSGRQPTAAAAEQTPDPSAAAARQDQEPKETMLELLLRRREEAGGIFICDCKDERWTETPALRALAAELTKRGVEFKQPLFQKYTYYLNRLIPQLRQNGKVWVIYNHNLEELSALLQSEFFDKQEIVFEQRFPEGTLALVANKFADGAPQPYGFEACGQRGDFTTNIAFTPGGEYFLASTKAGRVRWFELGNPDHMGTALLLPRAKKGQAGCFSGGESGLVGMVLHPNCAENHRAFLHYNWQYEDGTRDAIISEWRLDMSQLPAAITLEDERKLLLIEQTHDTHNAGQLVFGPDGFLYIGVGDGHQGTVKERSPAHNLRGKVLRIDVDHKDEGLEYAIPADNPYVGVEGFRPETWAWGFRNPWRLSFLPDGRLIAGDIGEDVNEELTFVVKGRHHGWPYTEGAHQRYPFTPKAEQQPALLPYGRSTGMSVVAGQVYRGDALPELKGKFLFGDYLSGFVWAIDVPDDTSTTLTIDDAEVVVQWPLMMPTIVEGPDRELYFGAHNGQVMKLVRGTGKATADTEEMAKADPSTARGMFGSDYRADEGPSSTAAQVELGKRLFFSAALSPDGQRSCATCHPIDGYGQDGRVHAPTGGGPARNTASIFNTSRQFAQFRDYRAMTVEEAVVDSLTTHVGFPSAAAAAAKVAGDSELSAAFAAAFDGAAPTPEAIGQAIGAHLRRLDTSSRWERFLDGDDEALSDEELVGLGEFMQAGCTTCHLYRGLGGHMHQKLGLLQPWTGPDKGHGTIDPESGQEYFFRVATLFNVAETAPYYHDGSMKTLHDAVRHMAKAQMNRDLSDKQVTAIVAFLKSLTGDIPAAARR